MLQDSERNHTPNVLMPTSAVLVMRLTLTPRTPSVPLRAPSIAELQEPQVMPPILRRVVESSPLPRSLVSKPASSTVLSSCSCKHIGGDVNAL